MDPRSYCEAVDAAAIFSEADLSGTITYVNPKFCEISGYAASELIGQNHRILRSGVQDAAFFEHMWSTLSAGEVWHGVICNRTKAGSLYWVDSTIVPVLDEATGLPRKYVSIRFDLTAERNRIDHALSRREEECHAFQQDKKSALMKLAAGVAHEINNPIGFVACNLNSVGEYLTALLTFASTCEKRLLQAGNAPGLDVVRQLRDELEIGYIAEDAAELIRQSRDGVTRVQTVVRNLRNFARPELGGAKEAVDLRHCLETTLAMLHHELQEKADVELQVGALPMVEGCPQELNQVFMSLLVNAAQSITAARGRITLQSGMDDAQVWIDVQDTGCGIIAGDLERIFEPFFTTKEVGHGTGLGLSSARGIIQRHGGTLTVRSQPGKGSTFRVSLPTDRLGPAPLDRVLESQGTTMATQSP